MKLKKIKYNFSICQTNDFTEVNLNDKYYFIGKTEEEFSVVCLTENCPKNTIKRDDGCKAIKIEGVLDFSLIGILSKIATILADNKIGIFAVSTYNTDYILTKEENYEKALTILASSGYEIN